MARKVNPGFQLSHQREYRPGSISLENGVTVIWAQDKDLDLAVDLTEPQLELGFQGFSEDLASEYLDL